MHFATAAAISLLVSARIMGSDDWAQFRGPNAQGQATEAAAPPIQFGPNQNLRWRCPLTRGLSSPCVLNGRIFLTEFDAGSSQLAVVAVNQADGALLWRVPVEAAEIERVHKVSSPANATVAADDERIYVYFASCGLYCFDHEGQPQWDYAMPVSQRINGSGTSPVIVDGRVILNREDNQEKYLLALDAETGKEDWKQPHGSLLALFGGGGGMAMGEATPILWKDQIVLHRQDQIVGFDQQTGKRQWTIGLKTTAASTPVIADDVLYVAAWNNFGEPDLHGDLPEYEDLVKKHDKNEDGMLSREELPWGPAFTQRPELKGRGLGGDISVKFMFDGLDQNKDGNIGSVEWNLAAGMTKMMSANARHGLTAIRLTADDGSVRPKQIWIENRSVSEVPSPLVVGEHVYMIKNGGILTCLERETGKVVYRERFQAAGPYYASLVAAGDVIYAASGEGVLSIVRAGPEFELLSSVKLGEPIFATLAIVGETLYVRTDQALYAFTNE